MISIIFFLFIFLLILGIPIFLTMGTISAIVFGYDDRLITLAQKIVDELNSPTLMTVPYFVIAATFMERGGVAKALIESVTAWIGHIHGGLGLVAIITCAIFAAMCGSSVATAIAMGTILIPSMLRNNYDPGFAGGIVASAGTLGILIPPSLVFIVYGMMTDSSIPRLFLGGIIPGLISVILMCCYVYFTSRKKKYINIEPIKLQEKIQKTMFAIPALMIPIIILGGLYGGFVTLTETAALSAIIAMILSLFVYREIKLNQFFTILTYSIRNAASIMIIIAMAMALGHLITETGIANKVLHLINELDIKSWQFLLIINIIMIFLGMFLEVLSIMLIMIPIVAPLLEPMGIDPIHFGVMLVINMELALMSPPVGLNLFVISNISKIPLTSVLRGTIPFFVLMLMMLIVVTYVPIVSTWLPNYLMGY